jgi:hypothetical protein
MTYTDIKKELLKNENINKVYINSSKKLITIEPVQNKDFYNIGEPLESYIFNDNDFLIGGKLFKIHDYEHFNTTIYYILLKEK